MKVTVFHNGVPKPMLGFCAIAHIPGRVHVQNITVPSVIKVPTRLWPTRNTCVVYFKSKNVRTNA